MDLYSCGKLPSRAIEHNFQMSDMIEDMRNPASAYSQGFF